MTGVDTWVLCSLKMMPSLQYQQRTNTAMIFTANVTFLLAQHKEPITVE